MKISIIVAFSENNVIGKNNNLIWHISEDLKRFKKITLNHSIIMGRKTYDSLSIKPLPKRKNIIISSNTDLKYDGAIVVNSISDALKLCKDEKEIFICGGATIYEKFIGFASKLYITKIFENFEGDTFFPPIEYENYEIVKESEILTDAKSGLKYQFIDYVLKF